MATYPNALWSPSTVTEITHTNVNETIDELVAVMNALGASPHGKCASLRHMLDMVFDDAGNELANRLRLPNSLASSSGGPDQDQMTWRARIYPISAFMNFTATPNSFGETGGQSLGYSVSQTSHTFVGTANRIMRRTTFTFSPPDDPIITPLQGGSQVNWSRYVFVSPGNSHVFLEEKFPPQSTTSFNLLTSLSVTDIASYVQTTPVQVLLMDRTFSVDGDETGYS